MRNTAAAFVVALLVCIPFASAATTPEQDVRAAVKQYREALVKKDLAALEKIWTDDYKFIDAHGRVKTKADRLADLRSGATSLDKITHQEEPSVRVHGQVAIVFGDVTLVGKYGNREVSGIYRSTHIWVHDGASWRLVMNQLTAAGN